jgi:ParB/Sulfiredoxin domain
MTRRETFQFLAYRWDVTRARRIAETLPVHRFNAEPWFGLLGLIRVDHDHVESADLNQPVLVVRIRELGGSPLIIDGWHRLAKARQNGVTDLPVIILDEEQEYSVRIWGGSKGLPCLP